MIPEIGARVLKDESLALRSLADSLGDTFAEAGLLILAAIRGGRRVITCGIGKSGHIARKTAGTLASTGTPSLFLHAAEAVHGDLGMVTDGDVVILYSHSGETDEIVALFPALKANGASTILITGRPDSSAGRAADLVLSTLVTKEACPNNLAPTTSTTAMLGLSDALAVAVMESQGFTSDDFAKFHPSGTLGKRLLLRVADVMRSGADLAIVQPTSSFMDVLKSITVAGAGAACVVDDSGNFTGFVSEGDLRRHLISAPDPLTTAASAIMKKQVTTIEPDLLAYDALEAFQNHPMKIGEMPVLAQGKPIGMLMLKDLLRSGII